MPDLYDLYYRINGKTQLIYYYYDETNRYLGLEYGNIKKDYIYSDLSEDALRRLKQIVYVNIKLGQIDILKLGHFLPVQPFFCNP